ncbi:MAG: hypothetical protein ACI8X5_000512 [Planctomycetota bacterium]|jgi:hypothetical protein
MKNQLLLPILALVGIGLFVLWQFAMVDELPTEEDGVELVRQSSIEAATGTILPELAQKIETQTERAEVAPVKEPSRVVTSSSAAPASNARWINGRVVFPERMPTDMGEIKVTARGRRFGDKTDGRREHTVSIDRDGKFRVAFSESTERGWLDVRGRYLYMPEKLSLELDDVEGEVLVEPEMGGVLEGHLLAPVGRSWTAALADDARVSLSRWDGSGMIQRGADVDSKGHYVLTAIPPGSNFNFHAAMPEWCDQRRGDIKVRSGEAERLDLQLKLGAIVSGRVVNSDNVGRAGVIVEVRVSGMGSWSQESTQTKDDGSFEFKGVGEEDVVLKAGLADHLSTEEELGRLADGSERRGVLLTIGEGNFIEGIVQWPDGSAAAGAVVSAMQEREKDSPMFDFRDGVSDKSGADGTFRITGLESSKCVVRASAKSFRKQELDKAKEREKEGRSYKLRARGPIYKTREDDVSPGTRGLVLVLEQGDSLSGRVLDDLGEGVKRFKISAEPVEGSGDDFGRSDSVERLVVSMDGAFTIDGLSEGTWQIEASASKHSTSQEMTVNLPGAGKVDLTVSRWAEVKGVVRGPGGDPISGADVWVERLEEGEKFDPNALASRWGEDATTNEDGEFTVKDARSGRSVVRARADGFGTSNNELIEALAGETVKGISLQLRPGGSLNVQLHASVGEVEGRQINIQGTSSGNYWNRIETDSRGEAELDGLDPGSYRLTLQNVSSSSGNGALSIASPGRSIGLDVDVKAGQKESVVLGAPPANPTRVTGRVLAGGVPLANVRISCGKAEGEQFNNDATQTDGDGVYAMNVSGSGLFWFHVGNRQTGVTQTTRELTSGDNPGVDFELPVGRIAGRVMGSDGEPKASCSMHLERLEAAQGDTSDFGTMTISTNGEGRYEFTHVPAGTFFIRVNDHGRSWGRRSKNSDAVIIRDGIKIDKGSQLDGMDFTLEEEAVLKGQVTGSDGMPLQRAHVEVTTLSGHRIYRNRAFTTDAGGKYEFTGLADGRVLVRAIYEGSETKSVEVRLQSGGISDRDFQVDSH